MKIVRFLFASVLLPAVLFTSCKKKEYDNVSKVKTVPTIEVIGQKFITINVGQTYTEQGATFINESGQSSTIQPEESVDVNTPGLYVLNYARTTESQFQASDARYVAVTNIPASLDLSGDYLRAATGLYATVTRMSRGLYRSENFGGSSVEITAYFAQTNDTTIVIPEQPTITQASTGKVSYAGGDTTLIYKVYNPSFGTGSRTFVKQ